VDVIISNCVINLSADKAQVIREAHRVLNAGGRFAVSDVVLRGELPEPVLKSVGLWTGCVSGALHENEYTRLLRAAGFTDISVEPTRVYSHDDVKALLDSAGLTDDGLVDAVAVHGGEARLELELGTRKGLAQRAWHQTDVLMNVDDSQPSALCGRFREAASPRQCHGRSDDLRQKAPPT